MASLMRCLPRRLLCTSKQPFCFARHNSSKPIRSTSTDHCGIPISPVWSVNQLLSSYPSPKLSDEAFKRLHKLSALISPETGTEEYANVKKTLEEMIRLVEAVRLVNTEGVEVSGRREKEDADRTHEALDSDEESGQELLKYSSRTRDGYYIVDSERRR